MKTPPEGYWESMERILWRFGGMVLQHSCNGMEKVGVAGMLHQQGALQKGARERSEMEASENECLYACANGWMDERMYGWTFTLNFLFPPV